MIEPTWQKKKVAKILRSLAAAYLANRQYDNAVEKFLQLKSLGDENPSTTLGLAGAFLGLKKTTPEALHAYRQFCDAFPEDASLISNIAELLLQSDVRSDEALHIYRCAIAFHPPFERTLHVVLLEALEQSGDIPLALQAARSAALLPGSDPSAVRKLVSLSWRQKRFDELLQELKMLAEQPALADEICRYLAVTLAYRALHNNVALSARDLKTVKQAGLSLLPIKSLGDARDYCVMQLAVAHSERPQMALAEAKAELDAEVFLGDAPRGALTKKATLDFFDGLIDHRDDEEARESSRQAMSDGGIAGKARAAVVVATRPSAAPVGEDITPRMADSTDWLLALFADQRLRAEQLRWFDDGLIAMAPDPRRLVEAMTDGLRKLAMEDFAAALPFFQPSILIHALPEEATDDPLQSLALLNTTLQLADNLPHFRQSEDPQTAASQARLFLTGEALAALKIDQNLAIRRRHACAAGVLGPEVEISEVLWYDPFDLDADTSPVQVGRFAVVSKICGTLLGSTFLARDHALGVTAILKSISRRGALHFDENAFVQGIRRVGRLTHPSLALIHDMGKRDGVFYFIREFVEGQSLADEACFAQVQSAAKVISLGVQASRALHYAHREGVLHLNLKPANFWITPDGKIKLTDFAIPGFQDSVAAANSENIYCAPEISESFSSSPASDVYSLAALLFLMLSHLPSPLPEDYFFGTLDLPPDQRVPQPLKEVLFNAVAHDPLSRPQSMAELERQLRECQMTLPAAEL
jgi:tetratricopeptide (TPR) repeat protein